MLGRRMPLQGPWQLRPVGAQQGHSRAAPLQVRLARAMMGEQLGRWLQQARGAAGAASSLAAGTLAAGKAPRPLGTAHRRSRSRSKCGHTAALHPNKGSMEARASNFGGAIPDLASPTPYTACGGPSETSRFSPSRNTGLRAGPGPYRMLDCRGRFCCRPSSRNRCHGVRRTLPQPWMSAASGVAAAGVRKPRPLSARPDRCVRSPDRCVRPVAQPAPRDRTPRTSRATRTAKATPPATAA
jgi:hypothetical protein